MSKESSGLVTTMTPMSSGVSLSKPLQQVAQVTKRYPQELYSMRRVKSKGAILILILNLLVTSVHPYMYILHFAAIQSYCRAALAIIGLTLPFAGWLADVHFGRYKVLSCSLGIMWVGSLSLTLMLLVNYEHEDILTIILLVPIGIGWGGFQANVIQFGIDQFVDASTSELKSFIAWYTWTYMASLLMMCFFLQCISYKVIVSLFICCSVTLALTLKFIFGNVLIIEPNTPNPFKLVYQVVNYAIKHKQPRQRSAFTYCEDTIPSRIDFGKRKYGGPFTTEQVEDVKTLLRIVVVLTVGCVIYSISDEGHFTNSKLNVIFKSHPTNQLVGQCSKDFIFTGFYFISGTIVILVYEFLVHPLFHRHLPNLISFYKFALGAFLRIGKVLVLLVLVTYSRVSYLRHIRPSLEASLPCLFHISDGVLGAYVDYRWTTISEFIYAVSDLMIYIACIEFLCAQGPYSMKGLVIGMAYAFISVYIPVFNYALEALYGKKSLNWGHGAISCGFWSFLTKISLIIIGMIAFIIVIKWYKRRKREDVLPNEQIYAERYYSTTS